MTVQPSLFLVFGDCLLISSGRVSWKMGRIFVANLEAYGIVNVLKYEKGNDFLLMQVMRDLREVKMASNS